MRGVFIWSLLLSARERVDCRLDETRSRISLVFPFSCCWISPSPAPVQEHMNIFCMCKHYCTKRKIIYRNNIKNNIFTCPILIKILMKGTIFLDLMLCGIIKEYRCFRRTSANICQITLYHIWEDSILHTHRHNIKFIRFSIISNILTHL